MAGNQGLRTGTCYLCEVRPRELDFAGPRDTLRAMGTNDRYSAGEQSLAREVLPAKLVFGISMFDWLLSLGIRLAALAVVLGWLLSACGLLELRGYLLAGVPAAVAVVLLSSRGRSWSWDIFNPRRAVVWWERKRPLPLLYLLSFALVVPGSLWHEPNNFDGLSYRAAKVLFWLKAHHWCWIYSPYSPINHTLPNYEWLTVPLFLATGGFHSTVIINWLAFLLVPPLFFSFLRALGANGRLAWDWMWLFPSGYIIVMLAGGIGNDLLGLTTILAGLHFARRFAASGNGGFLLDALLAAGFCTGVKLSNLPLAAFVLIFLLKEPRRLLAKKVTLASGIVLGALASALIPLLLNRAHSGSILGGGHEDLVSSPAAGWIGNSLIMLVGAMAPPIFPAAGKAAALLESALGNPLVSWLQSHYGKFTLKLNELPQEEGGGLGLGITLGVIICLVSWARSRKGAARPVGSASLLPWQWAAYWTCLGIGLAALTAKLGTGPAVPRNLLPWSPLVLGPVLALLGRVGGASARLWRIAAPLIMLSVLPALLLTPSRPLVPPGTLIALAERAHLGAAAVERLRSAYGVYAQRADPFIAIRQVIPPDVEAIGLVSDGGEPTAAWFKPFGRRWPVYLLSAGDVEAARSSGKVSYVVIKEPYCEECFKMPAARWSEKFRAQPIQSFEVRVFASWAPIRYTVVRLEP